MQIAIIGDVRLSPIYIQTSRTSNSRRNESYPKKNVEIMRMGKLMPSTIWNNDIALKRENRIIYFQRIHCKS